MKSLSVISPIHAYESGSNACVLRIIPNKWFSEGHENRDYSRTKLMVHSSVGMGANLGISCSRFQESNWLGRKEPPPILQITCVVFSLGLFSRRPSLSESLGAWEYHAQFPVLNFGEIFIVTCASPPVTSVFSVPFDRRTRQKTAGTQSNVFESLAHVNLEKAAHSRKYWNSITCGHLSHITCSVSICTLLFWGKHGLTDSTHLRFLQLPSVHDVFGCSYRKKN